MIGFFMLRRLIELHEVSSAPRDRMLNVFSYQARGKKITLLNEHHMWTLYDFDHEVPAAKKPAYIANQFIHSYTSYIARDETRNWSDVFVVSDYDRNDRIWRVPISEIQGVFRGAAADYPYSVQMVFNPQKGDYDVKTN